MTNTDDAALIAGEWLIVRESFLDFREVPDDLGGRILAPFINTNYTASVSNNGAVSIIFKPDGFADRLVYNGQGNIDIRYTNYYSYVLLSIMDTDVIEMTELSSIEETIYCRYSGTGYYTNAFINMPTWMRESISAETLPTIPATNPSIN